MNPELNKQTLEKLKLAKEDAIQKNLNFEYDEWIEMFEKRVKEDQEEEKNYNERQSLISDKEYAENFFDSFSNITLKRPLITSSRCRGFTLGYGQFKDILKNLKLKRVMDLNYHVVGKVKHHMIFL